MLILTLKVGHLEYICFRGRGESVLQAAKKPPVFPSPGKQTAFHFRGATRYSIFAIGAPKGMIRGRLSRPDEGEL